MESLRVLPLNIGLSIFTCSYNMSSISPKKYSEHSTALHAFGQLARPRWDWSHHSCTGAASDASLPKRMLIHSHHIEKESEGTRESE